MSTHVRYGQTAGWIKMSFGTEVGLSPGDFVLDRDPDFLQTGGTAPQFSAMSIEAKRLDGLRCHLVRR